MLEQCRTLLRKGKERMIPEEIIMEIKERNKNSPLLLKGAERER